ncbi:MAG: hypothetical protein QHD01_08280 [Bradyrhizobium sp.]|uniref:hypothetical protein n=1 Tax=Bradyrhizobium sp. TaxID=376 RepID=UPI0029ACC445|nr:hypothetical protein [Bradyrhizobium sp.]MDX3966582.1 hypothetical protein [Bradyrhizobium sp.]
MIMLFLHGIAQGGRTSEILREEWLAALNLGLEHSRLPPYKAKTKNRLVVPFYGDILAGTSADRKRRSSDYDLLKFAAEFEAEALGPVAVQASADRQRKGIQNWASVLKFTRMIDKSFPDISARFIQRFLKEVHAYLCDDATHAAVNERVMEELKEIDDELVVVSHSLGTVVAFHLLCSLNNKVSVSQLITLGSPLSIEAVKTRLRSKPRRPSSVKNWLNGFDVKDIVALHPLDQEHFARTKPAITNYSQIRNFTENHHSIAGYLSDATVARSISRSLK